jgi:hypothetical protein
LSLNQILVGSPLWWRVDGINKQVLLVSVSGCWLESISHSAVVVNNCL